MTKPFLKAVPISHAHSHHFRQGVDKSSGGNDNGGMEYVPRPELDAKLETIEVRMDGRLARIEDSVQRIVDMAAEIKTENRDIRQSVSSLKTTMIVTAIGAVLTIVLGVAAFNATLQSNMLSAFQAGQQTNQPAPPAK